MTSEQIISIMPYAKSRIIAFIEPLNKAMEEFEINTSFRQSAFLAQIGHESGQFKYVQELSSGDAYEGRKDLGNIEHGDGVKYKGRGLIQITGRSNYTAMMLALNIDCIDHPELIEQPINACRSAGWFWKTHGLNELSDVKDFEKITRRINGGFNGQNDRLALYEKAKQVLL